LNSLLSVAHLSAGTLDLHREKLNMVELSHYVLNQIEPEISKKKVELRVTLPDEFLEAYHDYGHLTHALTHILDHAVRYTETGSIQFDLRREQNDVIFRIIDTGRGFEPAFVRSIREPINSVNLAEFGLNNNSGLGLRVANGLLEELGGTLEIRSEVGVGSTFTARLPVMNRHRSSDRPTQTKESPHRQQSPVPSNS
jgi:signal transduction histidine kinase